MSKHLRFARPTGGSNLPAATPGVRPLEQTVGANQILSIVTLEDGCTLRAWVEELASQIQVSCIRCATFAVGAPGLLWLLRLGREQSAQVRLLSDDGQSEPSSAPPAVWEAIEQGRLEWRTVGVRPGSTLSRVGWFHPKALLLDDQAASVGSANLTGMGLGLGIPPYHVEMSVGLSGTTAQTAIATLVEVFDRWWEDGRPVNISTQSPPNVGDRQMPQPEYVVFQDRPMWGIAQVQSEGSGLFGQEQWLAVSDLSPTDPEHHPARIQVPQQFVSAVRPEPWNTPAEQLEARGVVSADNSKEHFRRLCAYWLQAENRQGQLDNVPVLPLRHQASLVEYLSRPSTVRRMLIADEVGLGKTVEMGLLLERLHAANPNLRVLYVTPGSLVTNVVDEFKTMGLEEFWVFANSFLDEEKYPPARLGHKKHDPRVVASLHRLGHGNNAESRLRLTKWDVVIADECHRLRMYRSAQSQKAQKWFRLLEMILGEHIADDGRVYFLSGTPHQGNREVFLNLIGLLCGLDRGATIHEQQRALAN